MAANRATSCGVPPKPARSSKWRAASVFHCASLMAESGWWAWSLLGVAATALNGASINMQLKLNVEGKRQSLSWVFIWKIITFTHRHSLMKIASKTLFVFACVTGAMPVLTAAYVAHQHALPEDAVRSLQSSVQLQQIHAFLSH